VIVTVCTGFNSTRGWKFSLRWCSMWRWSGFAMQGDFEFIGSKRMGCVPECTLSTWLTWCFLRLKHRRISVWSRLTDLNCFRIETDFKSEVQIRAWVQLSRRLLKNTLDIKIKSYSNTALRFNCKACSNTNVSANLKLGLHALVQWKLFHANGQQHHSLVSDVRQMC